MKNLEMAFMGGFSARNDRWTVGADVIYMDVKNSTRRPIGTGDSKSTWQGFAGLGYQFSKVSILGGYRYLNFDFDNKPDSLMSELTIDGPLMAVKFQF